jgi:CRISPR-associated protein Cmr2
MLKRLWPTIFTEDVQAHVQGERLSRYVVSTHTMALASAIDAASQRGTSPPADMQGERVALPARLARTLRERSMEAWGRVPGWVEDRQAAGVDESAAEIDARRMGQLFGRRPDAYFGMLLMDGDGMGAWLSASSTLTPRVSESFHPVLRERLSARFGVDEKFVAYAGARRAPNPAWHMAISQALNHFSLELAPAVIEREHLGKLIYAGGDDVLAMLATRDLLPAAAQLRAVYSGCMPDQVGAREPEGQRLARSGSGWAQFDGRVLRLMGDKATASAGLVIAHHQAPLAAVLRKLREAEQQAKALPGKNAWSLAVLKRGGGALSVTAHWGEPLRLFEALRAFLMQEDVSRRAAYHVAEWLHDLPTDARAPSASLLAYQMARQARGEASKSQARDLARRLVELAFDDRERVPGTRPLDWLGDFMSAAEFLAREQRHDTATPTQAEGVRA